MRPSKKPHYERAARALCELAGNPSGATMDGKPLWMSYLPEVRAVLAAIREPIERPGGWGWNDIPGINVENGICQDSPGKTLHVMISAMLTALEAEQRFSP